MTASTMLSAEEIASYQAFIGRQEIRCQVLDIEALCRFAAAVGASLDVERTAPPLAHWAYFLETVTAQQLGPDGHPKRGEGLMPPIRLPRRMFAAAAIRNITPLSLGREAELKLALVDVRYKAGSTGDLMFADVDRVLTQSGQVRVLERQTIVYREAGEAVRRVEPTPSPPVPGQQIWTPSPVDLFRFSAATFNAHRIHYDLSYAQGEEGYPGIVVQGPLVAAKLLAFAQEKTGSVWDDLTLRLHAPLFSLQPIRLSRGAESGQFQAIRCDGVVAASVRPTHRSGGGHLKEACSS